MISAPPSGSNYKEKPPNYVRLNKNNGREIMSWRQKYWIAGTLLTLSGTALALSQWLERMARRVLGRAPLPLFKDR